ncbi:hypothetical protein HID58_055484, partial [Brassica napus]
GFVRYENVDEDGLLGVKPCLGGCKIGELWSWTSLPLSLGRSYVLEYFLFFSDLGRLLLVQDKSLGLEAGGRTQTRGRGPRPGGRDLEAGGRNPGPGSRNPGPGSRNLEAAGNNMIFFIGLHEFHHGIKLLVEFGVGRRLVAMVFKLSYRTCFSGHVFGLSEDGHMDVVLILIMMVWNWIIRKTIMQDLVNALRACITVAGSMNRVEECMGQDPGILRGRILARLRIRGMRRFNKTRRTKLRILMLDSAGRFRTGVELLDMLFVDHGHVFPESEDLEIHPSETHGSWILDGLSSRNPEAGWTFVLEPGGRMDFCPGTRRLVELLSRNLMVVWTFKGTLSYIFSTRSRLCQAFWSSVFLYQNLGASSNASSSYPWEDLQTEPDVLGIDARVGAGASLNRNLDAGVLPEAWMTFPNQFSTYFLISSSNSGNNLCIQVKRSCSFSAGFPWAGHRSSNPSFPGLDRVRIWKRTNFPGIDWCLVDVSRLLALHVDWTARHIGLAGEDHLYLLKSAVGDLLPFSEAGILDLRFALQ